jgi:hypothetical protein
MGTLKWTVMLLAFHLMGLFDSKSITAAPVYSEHFGMRDNTSIDMNDDISGTHEINNYAEGNDKDDDDGVADKGEGRISSKEGQEVGNEKESGGSNNENFEMSSNPRESSDVARSQGTSNEDEKDSDKTSDNKSPEEENKSTPVLKSGIENVDEIKHKDTSAGGDSLVNDRDVSSQTNGSPSLPHNSKENEHDTIVDSNMGVDIAIHKSSAFTEAPDSESLAGRHDNRELPLSESRMASSNKDDNASYEGAVTEGHGHNELHPAETSDEGEHVNHEMDAGVGINDEEDTDAASEDNEDTGAVPEDNEDTGAAPEDNEDTGAAHDDEEDINAAPEDNKDTGAAPEDNKDTGGPHNHEEDTGAAHDDGEDTDAASEDNEDTGEAPEDNKDTGGPHNDEEDTGAAHDDDEDTDAAPEDNEDTGAAPEDNKDTGEAPEDNEDTGAVPENNEDTGAAHDDEEDTGAAHDDEEDTGAAHDDEEDTGAAPDDNEDTGAAPEDNKDKGAPHNDEEDTSAAPEDKEDTGAAQGANEGTGAAHDDEKHTLTENYHEEDYNTEHDNEEDFGVEFVHKENHIAAHEDNEKYTAVSREVSKEETTKTKGTNDKGLAPHVYHEEAAAGLVHTHGTGNSDESSGDAEERDIVDISNSDVKAMDLRKSGGANYSHDDYEEGEGRDEEEEEEEDEEEEEYNDNSGVAEVSSERMLGRMKDDNDDNNDDINSKENDSNIDTSDTHVSSNEESFMVESEDESLNVEGSRELEESTLKPSSEIKIERFHADGPPGDSIASNEGTTAGCNCSNNMSETRETGHKHGDKNKDKPDAKSIAIAKSRGEEEDQASDRTDEYNVTKSILGSENSTVISGPQLRKEEIRKEGDDSINELGSVSQSQDSEHSQSSTGSYVVLGVIMATIVVLLGYSVIKSRRRNAQEAKNEDFGTEMADVKKTLLPRNEFNGGIHPTVHPEADESNAKLLADTQYRSNTAESEETHKVEARVQNQKDVEGYDDSHPKQAIDSDRIETQSEPNAPDNTSKSHSQKNTNPFLEDGTTKKVETDDVKSAKAPLNTFKPHSQKNINSFPEGVTPKKVETADVKNAHHPVEAPETPHNAFKTNSQDNTFPGVTPKKGDTPDVQSAHHMMEPPDAPDNAFQTSSQKGTNSFPEVVTPEQVETANVQSKHDPSHQNGYSNVNGVSEIVAETPPSVPAQNNYVTANSGGLVTAPGGMQAYTLAMPVTRVRATVVDQQPSSVRYYYR